jgi:hypothetical protein
MIVAQDLRGVKHEPVETRSNSPFFFDASCMLDPIMYDLGIDYVGYAMGQTDTFQGTGVFSGIKMQREPTPSSSTDNAGTSGTTAAKEASKLSETAVTSKDEANKPLSK